MLPDGMMEQVPSLPSPCSSSPQSLSSPPSPSPLSPHQHQLAAALQRATALEEALQRRTAELDFAETELKVAQGEARRQAGRLSSEQAQSADALERRLTAAKRQMAAAADALAAAGRAAAEATGAAEASAAAAEARAANAEARAAAAEVAATGLGAELERMRCKVKALSGRCEDLSDDLVHSKATAHKRVEYARAEAAASRQQAAFCDEEVRRLGRKLAALRSEQAEAVDWAAQKMAVLSDQLEAERAAHNATRRQLRQLQQEQMAEALRRWTQAQPTQAQPTQAQPTQAQPTQVAQAQPLPELTAIDPLTEVAGAPAVKAGAAQGAIVREECNTATSLGGACVTLGPEAKAAEVEVPAKRHGRARWQLPPQLQPAAESIAAPVTAGPTAAGAADCPQPLGPAVVDGWRRTSDSCESASALSACGFGSGPSSPSSSAAPSAACSATASPAAWGVGWTSHDAKAAGDRDAAAAVAAVADRKGSIGGGGNGESHDSGKGSAGCDVFDGVEEGAAPGSGGGGVVLEA